MSRSLPRFPRFIWYGLGLIVLLGVAWLARPVWQPAARRAWAVIADPPPAPKLHDHDHGGHEGHAHEGHVHGEEAADSLELSPQAVKNIGLTTGTVALGPYERTISIPAIVAEQPGRTSLIVPAQFTGFVEDIFAVPGQSVAPGDPLFVLRLTNEDVVQAQTEYLKTLEALDVEDKEIKRLESITSGVIAEKVILTRKYERQKLEGLLKAQRQALILHGMTEAQADSIAKDRRLLRAFLVSAPEPHDETEPHHLEREHPELIPPGQTATTSSLEAVAPAPKSDSTAGDAPGAGDGPSLVVQSVPVKRGQSVQAGEALAILADLRELFLEGRAFERDAPAVSRAVANGWTVTAVPEQSPGIESLGGSPPAARGLQIAYVANAVDPETRTLRFFVILPNEIVEQTRREDGRVFPTWRYKPGQRMEVRVPIEQWRDRIVLPLAAVADDGPEAYVFVRNGRTFQRRPVHVEYRGRDKAVIANDGSIFPGETVALSAVQQLQMAIQNKTGGGVDVHAGHMH
jgi:multidrug efflux pump subunit AcrA (membrane-fusion protein)